VPESSASGYAPRLRSDRDRAICARTFRIDAKAAEVVHELAADGVPAILLKGHAFASLLYRDGSLREYMDVDLLVSASASAACACSLRRQGFEPFLLRADDPLNPEEHADTWRRPADNIEVDIHFNLPEARCAPQTTWDTLSAHTQPLNLVGEEVRVLDPAASALLVALHRAHHDAGHRKPSDDLLRATEAIDADGWRTAMDLAVRLDALGAFLAGLHYEPAGRALSDRLGLPDASHAPVFVPSHDASRERRLLEELRLRSPRERVRLVMRVLAANPRALRVRSPLARRGLPGLVAAYVLRPFDLGWRFARATRDARRERARR
jgi:hypothetical protein